MRSISEQMISLFLSLCHWVDAVYRTPPSLNVSAIVHGPRHLTAIILKLVYQKYRWRMPLGLINRTISMVTASHDTDLQLGKA